MKLLFIFTGGTIGSTAGNGLISTDGEKPRKLLLAYRTRYGLDAVCDTSEPYTALSENADGHTLHLLLRSVREGMRGGYDGIIVTHGTDTLQYAAAALSYAAGSSSIPICLVSSNYPIEHPDANGLDNLHGAIRLIQEGSARGVFVIYRNPEDVTRIHRGTRLLRSVAYSDCFYSVLQQEWGYFDAQMTLHRNPRYRALPDAIPPLSDVSTEGADGQILRIDPYPGMCYPALSRSIAAVLHGSFHSGTINTLRPDYRQFFEDAHRLGIPVYLSGAADGISYESTALFDKLHILPLPSMAPIAAYVKLWLGRTLSLPEIMNHSLSEDLLTAQPPDLSASEKTGSK
jgi:L-asparaginase